MGAGDPTVWTIAVAVLAGVGAVAAPALTAAGREAWAFSAGGLAIVAGVLTVFLQLWPNVLVSSTAEANSLTVAAAASSNYTLTVMTIVTALLLPLVLLYQGWTYWVFRRRVKGGLTAARRRPQRPSEAAPPRGGGHTSAPRRRGGRAVGGPSNRGCCGPAARAPPSHATAVRALAGVTTGPGVSGRWCGRVPRCAGVARVRDDLIGWRRVAAGRR